MSTRGADILGWSGVLAIFGAYVLLTIDVLGAHTLWYQGITLLGSLAIAVETWHKRDLQPFWLNVAWSTVALIAIGAILFT